jgi:hypothetical protein
MGAASGNRKATALLVHFLRPKRLHRLAWRIGARGVSYPGPVVVATEWADALALPIAPLVLLLQLGALFIPRFVLRAAGASVCAGSIWLMYHYVSSIELAPNEGANIGAGVLLLWWSVSLLLVGVAVVGELVRIVVRHGDVLPSEGPPD